MMMTAIGKAGAILLLGGALAGCVNATLEVDLLSETTARTTVTQVITPEFYAMMALDEELNKAPTVPEDAFCPGSTLTETANGGATCIAVDEGPFGNLTVNGEEQVLTYAEAGPGLVRIGLPTTEIQAELASNELTGETQQMMEAFYAGKTITIRFSGAAIEETNMKLSKDKTTAEAVVPFLDLIRGKADLPDEFYAVVRAP